MVLAVILAVERHMLVRVGLVSGSVQELAPVCRGGLLQYSLFEAQFRHSVCK